MILVPAPPTDALRRMSRPRLGTVITLTSLALAALCAGSGTRRYERFSRGAKLLPGQVGKTVHMATELQVRRVFYENVLSERIF